MRTLLLAFSLLVSSSAFATYAPYEPKKDAENISATVGDTFISCKIIQQRLSEGNTFLKQLALDVIRDEMNNETAEARALVSQLPEVKESSETNRSRLQYLNKQFERLTLLNECIKQTR